MSLWQGLRSLLPRRGADAPRLRFPPAAAEISDEGITVSRYPYRHATLFGKIVTIPPQRVTSVFASPGEAAFVLDAREVIFLAPEHRDAVQAFAQRHGIARPALPDVWSMLCDPYLDTEYTSEDEQRQGLRFEELGFSREEVRRLRRKIRWTMSWLTFATWEWRFYTADDVLRAHAANPLRFTKAFYWLVMEVALRPYPTRGPGAGN